MKKSLIVIVSMLFVLGLVAVDYAAATDVTLSGSMRVRGDFRSNTDLQDTIGGSKSAYDQQVRLKVTAKVDPKVKGVIELEAADYDSDTYTWGSASLGAGVYQKGNAKINDISIRQAYISVKEAFGLADLKIGHQLLKFGNGIFFDHSKFGDDAIVLTKELQKGTDISLVAAKLVENGTSANDDVDLYAVVVKTKVGNVNVSGDVSRINDQDYTTGLGFGALGTEGLHFWNLGLRGDTKVAGVGLKADVELQTGKARKAATGEADLKIKGHAILLGASYKISDVKVGIDAARGSGDKIGTANKYEGFIVMHGSGAVAFLYDDKVTTAGTTLAGGVNTTKTGLNNTQYLKFYASTKATPKVSVSGAIFILKGVKKLSTTYKSKNIGTEIDAKVKYKLAKNVTYYVEGGYLIAGNMYKGNKVTDPDTSLGVGPDDAYGVRHGIVLKF